MVTSCSALRKTSTHAPSSAGASDGNQIVPTATAGLAPLVRAACHSAGGSRSTAPANSATGAFVRKAKVGDYVSAESHVTCGVCVNCRTGRAHMCEFTEILGVERDGAFAEYVAIPESVIWQNDRAKLPPEIATLQEPFGNAVSR